MKSKNNIQSLALLTLLLLTTQLWAQNPTPAPAQSEKIAVINATVHVGDGTVIKNGQVLFSKGKIERVSGPAKRALDDYKVVDAAGKHVYPGLIAMNTGIGLTEIGAVRATRDGREVGRMNPNVRAMIAFNTDSQVIPTVRSRGVMLAQTVPTGGRISGLSSVMEMDGWNYEDAVRAADEGIHFNWPRSISYSWWQRKYEQNKDYDKQVQELKDFLLQAKAYCSEGRAGDTQLKLEATCRLLAREATAYFHADAAMDIQAAVLMAKELGLKPVIVGGYEAYLITDFLKRENVPVILGSTQALPALADSDIDQPFKNPALLADAGVTFAISHGGYWEQRNLPFTGGTAVAYGLDYEKAIEAMTLTPAKITGLDQMYGSLEPGKSATLIVVSGDVLDMRTSVVEHAFIDGRAIDLDNKQAELDRKFREKYSRQ